MGLLLKILQFMILLIRVFVHTKEAPAVTCDVPRVHVGADAEVRCGLPPDVMKHWPIAVTLFVYPDKISAKPGSPIYLFECIWGMQGDINCQRGNRDDLTFSDVIVMTIRNVSQYGSGNIILQLMNTDVTLESDPRRLFIDGSKSNGANDPQRKTTPPALNHLPKITPKDQRQEMKETHKAESGLPVWAIVAVVVVVLVAMIVLGAVFFVRRRKLQVKRNPHERNTQDPENNIEEETHDEESEEERAPLQAPEKPPRQMKPATSRLSLKEEVELVASVYHERIAKRIDKGTYPHPV